MKTRYHAKVAKEAFRKHLTPFAIDRVIRYNFNVDFYGIPGWKIIEKKVFPLYPFGRHWYALIDHFDQMGSADFIEAWKQHLTMIMDILDDTKFPPNNLELMFRTLGRSSHSMTDAFTHSNIINFIYDFHREDPDRKKILEASGKELPDFLCEKGPLFSEILEEKQFEDFRKKYLPQLFSFESLPDKGPKCHDKLNIDYPNAPGAVNPEYPRIFDVVVCYSIREIARVVDDLFDKLEKNNPAKYEILTSAHKDKQLGEDDMGPCEGRAKYWSMKFGGYE